MESLQILERLAEVKSERLRLTFHTSSANFSSIEALQFLDGFNTLDEVTLMGKMTFKHTIRQDIEAFSDAEVEFQKRLQEKMEVDHYRKLREVLWLQQWCVRMMQMYPLILLIQVVQSARRRNLICF